jgi:hypothetical protein
MGSVLSVNIHMGTTCTSPLRLRPDIHWTHCAPPVLFGLSKSLYLSWSQHPPDRSPPSLHRLYTRITKGHKSMSSQDGHWQYHLLLVLRKCDVPDAYRLSLTGTPEPAQFFPPGPAPNLQFTLQEMSFGQPLLLGRYFASWCACYWHPFVYS